MSKSFGELAVVKDFSARVMRGDRVGIVGPNGSGKTTLLNLLTGKRRALLEGEAVPEDFAAALAQQCFINGYLFAQSAKETAQVAALRARVENGDRKSLLTLACYMSLGDVAGAEKFADGAALKQQRDEPASRRRKIGVLAVYDPEMAPHRRRGKLHFPQRRIGPARPELVALHETEKRGAGDNIGKRKWRDGLPGQYGVKLYERTHQNGKRDVVARHADRAIRNCGANRIERRRFGNLMTLAA